jgi:hypothetical protein
MLIGFLWLSLTALLTASMIVRSLLVDVIDGIENPDSLCYVFR